MSVQDASSRTDERVDVSWPWLAAPADGAPTLPARFDFHVDADGGRLQLCHPWVMPWGSVRQLDLTPLQAGSMWHLHGAVSDLLQAQWQCTTGTAFLQRTLWPAGHSPAAAQITLHADAAVVQLEWPAGLWPDVDGWTVVDLWLVPAVDGIWLCPLSGRSAATDPAAPWRALAALFAAQGLRPDAELGVWALDRPMQRLWAPAFLCAGLRVPRDVGLAYGLEVAATGWHLSWCPRAQWPAEKRTATEAALAWMVRTAASRTAWLRGAHTSSPPLPTSSPPPAAVSASGARSAASVEAFKAAMDSDHADQAAAQLRALEPSPRLCAALFAARAGRLLPQDRSAAMAWWQRAQACSAAWCAHAAEVDAVRAALSPAAAAERTNPPRLTDVDRIARQQQLRWTTMLQA